MRLTECFMDIVAYIAYFLKSVKKKQPPFEQVKTDILRLVDQSEAIFTQSAFSRDDYDHARFAIFAWIDEAVMNSPWEHKNQWLKEQLQRVYYQTADAGEIFFERLNSIGPHQRDVREVYYLCMAMGFTGRYCHAGDEYLLEQLKTSNLKLLTGSSMAIPELDKTTLFPDAYPHDISDAGFDKKTSLSSFTLLLAGCPVLLYISLFVIYRFILHNVGTNIFSVVP